jgi:hypothetical protein
MNIGIPACGVVSIKNKAAEVTPGVFAISTKVDALKFGREVALFGWHDTASKYSWPLAALVLG